MGIQLLTESLKQHLPIWSKLNEQERQMLLENTKQIQVPANTNEFSSSDCQGIFILLSGSMRAYMLSESGREITLFQIKQNDACVLSASCLLHQINFDIHSSVLSDCELLLIPAAFFSQLVQSNVYIENFMYQITTTRFSDVMWTIQQILFKSFDKRLASFLIEEIHKSESNIVQMTHEQVAQHLGSAREVVSRMLKYFEDENILSLGRGKIVILDAVHLQRIANG